MFKYDLMLFNWIFSSIYKTFKTVSSNFGFSVVDGGIAFLFTVAAIFLEGQNQKQKVKAKGKK